MHMRRQQRRRAGPLCQGPAAAASTTRRAAARGSGVGPVPRQVPDGLHQQRAHPHQDAKGDHNDVAGHLQRRGKEEGGAEPYEGRLQVWDKRMDPSRRVVLTRCRERCSEYRYRSSGHHYRTVRSTNTAEPSFDVHETSSAGTPDVHGLLARATCPPLTTLKPRSPTLCLPSSCRVTHRPAWNAWLARSCSFGPSSSSFPAVRVILCLQTSLLSSDAASRLRCNCRLCTPRMPAGGLHA